MSVQIKTLDFEPKRQTFGHVARRLGGDKPASRYQEATFDLQPTVNFSYKPIYEPEYWMHDVRKTKVVMEDWDSLLDPRQYYYGAYNIARANMNQAVDRNFVFVEERGFLTKISPSARAAIERGLLPMRHLHWGSNMNMTEICQRGWGAAVTAPCIFSSVDHLGIAQIISRIGLVLDGQTGASLDAAKQTWLHDWAWQAVRHLIEDTFVERDWFHLYVAQTLAVNAVLLDLIYRHSEAAWGEAGIPVAMLTEFMCDWRTEESRWSDSVVKGAAAESEANHALISKWAAHWIDRAVEAGRTLSAALLGDEGKAGEIAGDAARSRARALGLAL